MSWEQGRDKWWWWWRGCSHLWAQQCPPASWWVQCTAQKPASQTCCTAWWRLRCPGPALRCPCGADGPAGCLSLCPRKFSCPAAAEGETETVMFTSAAWGDQKNTLNQTKSLTSRSSLSAKDIIPSNMITLAPYTFFCMKIDRNFREIKLQNFFSALKD